MDTPITTNTPIPTPSQTHPLPHHHKHTHYHTTMATPITTSLQTHSSQHFQEQASHHTLMVTNLCTCKDTIYHQTIEKWFHECPETHLPPHLHLKKLHESLKRALTNKEGALSISTKREVQYTLLYPPNAIQWTTYMLPSS